MLKCAKGHRSSQSTFCANNTAHLTSIARLFTPSVEMALVQNSRVVEAGGRRVTLAVNPWDSLLRYFHKLNPIPASPFNLSVRMRRNWKLWKVLIKDCERGQDRNNFETIDDDSLSPPFNISVRTMRSSRITTGRLHIYQCNKLWSWERLKENNQDVIT